MLPSLQLVDLSHQLSPSISFYPGMTPPVIIPHKTFENESYYMITDLHLNSHHGTHMDAPCHFVDGTKSVDQLSLDQCFGRGRVIELECRDMKQVKEEIEGLSKEIEILLFRTGMSKHWGK
jgi:kynurenine formamidase